MEHRRCVNYLRKVLAVSLNIKDLFRVTSALQDYLVEPGTVSFILLAGGVGKRMGVCAAPKFHSRML